MKHHFFSYDLIIFVSPVDAVDKVILLLLESEIWDRVFQYEQSYCWICKILMLNIRGILIFKILTL